MDELYSWTDMVKRRVSHYTIRAVSMRHLVTGEHMSWCGEVWGWYDMGPITPNLRGCPRLLFTCFDDGHDEVRQELGAWVGDRITSAVRVQFADIGGRRRDWIEGRLREWRTRTV